MKTLFITEWYMPSVGGSVTIYDNVYNRYVPGEIFVLAKASEGCGAYDKKSKIPIYRVPYTEFKYLKPQSLLFYSGLFIYAVFLIITRGIKVIHCDMVMRAGVVGYWLKKLFKIPYIVYAHGEEIAIRLSKNKDVMIKIYNSSAFVIVNSGYTKDALIDLGVDENKVKIIHPGVDSVKFNPTLDSSPIKKRYNLEGKYVLLTVSNLVEWKGHETVLRAMKIALDKFSDIFYLIVGKGERENYLKTFAKKLSLEEHIIFAGQVADKELPSYYCACDIFVMISKPLATGHLEGFGIVFIEAAACGKPVIGGISGGTGDAVLNGTTGFLVNPDDIEGVAGKILTLLESPELSKKMGTEGRKRVENKFSWDDYRKKIQYLAKDIIDKKVN